MALAAGPSSFIGLRFLLGVAEAGFFPGVILYLTYWFPAEQRAKIIGIFMVAIPISGFIGSPISGTILGLDGWLDLRGWQWVFILEAVPAVLLGLACLAWLTDGPGIGEMAETGAAGLADRQAGGGKEPDQARDASIGVAGWCATRPCWRWPSSMPAARPQAPASGCGSRSSSSRSA